MIKTEAIDVDDLQDIVDGILDAKRANNAAADHSMDRGPFGADDPYD